MMVTTAIALTVGVNCMRCDYKPQVKENISIKQSAPKSLETVFFPYYQPVNVEKNFNYNPKK